MKARISLILQVIGTLLFLTGSFTSKNGNLLQFLVGCLTGLPPYVEK